MRAAWRICLSLNQARLVDRRIEDSELPLSLLNVLSANSNAVSKAAILALSPPLQYFLHAATLILTTSLTLPNSGTFTYDYFNKGGAPKPGRYISGTYHRSEVGEEWEITGPGGLTWSTVVLKVSGASTFAARVSQTIWSN